MANPEYAGSSATAPKMSPFDSLAEAVERYRDIQKFAGALADRIAGQIPKDCSKAIGEGAGGGLIDGLERQISFMRSIAQDINDSLMRIENRI